MDPVERAPAPEVAEREVADPAESVPAAQASAETDGERRRRSRDPLAFADGDAILLFEQQCADRFSALRRLYGPVAAYTVMGFVMTALTEDGTNQPGRHLTPEAQGILIREHAQKGLLHWGFDLPDDSGRPLAIAGCDSWADNID